MKTVLALETSCPILSVALGTGKGKIFEVRARRPLQHSENLIPLIEKLLRKAKLSLRQIDAFAIDRGPGSFTGLRIGFSFLKGLVAVRKKPCYGALSLDMMTDSVRLPRRGSSERTCLGVLVDARREAVYSRFYEYHRGEWAARTKLELLSLSVLMDRIREGTILTGDALIRYQETLRGTFGNRIDTLPPRAAFPRAFTLVRWFQNKDRRLALLESQRDWIPLYFRASEAEEIRRKLKRRAR